MKNYSKPELISPTLEKDVVNRLYESVKKVVSKEVAENLVNELSLEINATPKARAEWVDKLSFFLEKKYDEDTIKEIRRGCHCDTDLVESANSLKELYIMLGRDMHRFIGALNEHGAGWYMEDNCLYTKMLSCPCPMLEKAKPDPSLTWCHCTAGYNEKYFSIVFETQVKAEIIHSIRQGFNECLVRVEFPDGFLKV